MNISQVPKLTAFTGVHLGFNFGVVTVSNGDESESGTVPGISSILLAGSVGARYHLSQKFAAVGEIGFGTGFLRLGVDFKL